jgi:hypothetical protein
MPGIGGAIIEREFAGKQLAKESRRLEMKSQAIAFSGATIFAMLFVTGCSHGSERSDGYWLEKARDYAMQECVGFFDDENGEYEIIYRNGEVAYYGNFDLLSMAKGVWIVMDNKGRLLRISSGGVTAYPDRGPHSTAHLIGWSKEERCEDYSQRHDDKGRRLPGYSTEYEENG